MRIYRQFVICLLLILTACGSGGGDSESTIDERSLPESPQYTVRVQVSGLEGSLQLELNGSETLLLSSNGDFEFSTRLFEDDNYEISITNMFSSLDCDLTGETGIVSQGSPPVVIINCQTQNTVNFIIESSADFSSRPLTLLSVYSEQPVDLSSTTSVNTGTDFSLVALIDSNEDLVYLSIDDGDSSTKTIGASSTALSIVLMHPVVINYLNNQENYPSDLVSDISKTTEVESLSIYIEAVVESGQSWVDSSDAKFITLVGDATGVALILAEAHAERSQAVHILTQNTFSKKLANSSTRYSVSNLKMQEEFVKSSVLVTYDGGNAFEEGSKVVISVENIGARWIQVVTSDSIADDLLPPGILSTSKLQSSTKKIEVDREYFINNNFVVDVYGPGKTINIEDHEWDKAFAPTLMTMSFEVVFPAIAISSGSQLCIRDILKPKNKFAVDFLNQMVHSTQLVNAIKNGSTMDTVQVIGVEALRTILKLSGEDALTCVLKDATRKLIKAVLKLYSGVGAIYTATEVTIKLMPVLVTLNSSRVHEAWIITNDLQTELNVRKTSQSEPKESVFSGVCPAESICKRFQWNNEEEFSLDFKINCLNDAVCKEVVANFGDSAESQILRDDIWYEHAFSREGRYDVTFTAQDFDGAKSTINLVLAIESGEPSIQVAVGDRIVIQGELIFDFGDVEEGGTEESVFKVSNTGTSDLFINSILKTDFSDFSNSQISHNPISPGEDATFTIYFSPTVVGAGVRETFTITSNVSPADTFSFEVIGNGIEKSDSNSDPEDFGGNYVVYQSGSSSGLPLSVSNDGTVSRFNTHYFDEHGNAKTVVRQAGIFGGGCRFEVHLDQSISKAGFTQLADGTVSVTVSHSWYETFVIFNCEPSNQPNSGSGTYSTRDG